MLRKWEGEKEKCGTLMVFVSTFPSKSSFCSYQLCLDNSVSVFLFFLSFSSAIPIILMSIILKRGFVWGLVYYHYARVPFFCTLTAETITFKWSELNSFPSESLSCLCVTLLSVTHFLLVNKALLFHLVYIFSDVT